MNIKEEDELKNILTERAYRVKRIDNISVILESIEGTSHVWTVEENLKLFYEKMENKGEPEELKKLRLGGFDLSQSFFLSGIDN